MSSQRIVAIAFVLLLACNAGANSGTPAILGVVVDANRAHLSTNDVSVGTTVYDGDSLSTDSGGLLQLRSRAALLYVEQDSAAVLRSFAGVAEGAEAQLSRGKIVFSAARAAAVRIAVLGARVAPQSDAPTIAEVSITSPKELRIFARRGSVEFSYFEESELIPEGEICRVLLDPDDGSQPGSVKDVKKHRHKRFIVIAIATGAAVGAGAAYWATHSGTGAGPNSNVVSPDHP